MFLDGAAGGGACPVPRAALCGLAPEDEEILSLLLDILGWQCTMIPELTSEAAKGAQLVFVGRGQSIAGSGEFAIAQDVRVILVTETDAPTEQEKEISGFVETLLSPLDLRSAELIINDAAAAFVSRNAH